MSAWFADLVQERQEVIDIRQSQMRPRRRKQRISRQDENAYDYPVSSEFKNSKHGEKKRNDAEVTVPCRCRNVQREEHLRKLDGFQLPLEEPAKRDRLISHYWS